MKYFIATLTLVLFVNIILAQNSLVKQWDYRFGGEIYEYICEFHKTKDGGYILGGTSDSGINGDKTQNSNGAEDYWIVKIDSLGNKQWDKVFGGSNVDQLTSLQPTADGGFILGGTSWSGISGNKTQANWDTSGGSTPDYWIVKIDSLGNKQWDRDFGGLSLDYLNSLKQTSDGGFIIGGSSFSGIGGNKTQDTWGVWDYWIVKTDSFGNKQWDRDFGGTGIDQLYDLSETSDGGYILGGYSESGISGDKSQALWGGDDYWILKTDSLGNKKWDKDLGGTNLDYFCSLQQTSDNGFILGGLSNSPAGGDKTQATRGGFDYWIIKTDSLANKQWDKDFGGTYDEELSKVSQTDDGSYLISGDSYSYFSGDKTENNLGIEQTWILKTDSLGTKLWDKTLLTPGHDEHGIMLQVNGCYIISNSSSGGIGGFKTQPNWDTICNPWCTNDYWIIKFCDTTATTSTNQISDTHFSIFIYPNPTSDNIVFKSTERGTLTITNQLGQVVSNITITQSETVIPTDKLQSGMYLMLFQSDRQVSTNRILITR